MPNNVEELHVSLLKMREDLITAKVAQEVAQEKEETLRYEVTLLHEQMEQESRVKEQEILVLKNEISGLRYYSFYICILDFYNYNFLVIIFYRTQLDKYVRDYRSLAEREEKLERLEKELDIVLKENKQAELKVAELRQRVTSLQQELDTSEAVQKDFVRLSQSLQV